MSHHRSKPAGQERTYGLLVGRIKDGKFNSEGNSPHYEIWVTAGSDYRVAVNVQSVDDSQVLVHFDPDFKSPTRLNLPEKAAGAAGFSPLATGPDGEGLDYLRDGLFTPASMQPIPASGSGVTLANLLDAQVERAKADDDAIILVCGAFFRDSRADPTFGFRPEQGVHDVHMMQGNGNDFADDNRVNGDGALFIRFTGGETIALFVRFATQSLTTDDQTGQSR